MANIFYVEGGRFSTPFIRSGCDSAQIVSFEVCPQHRLASGAFRALGDEFCNMLQGLVSAEILYLLQ